ncbi:MAG: type II secretion system F family protein [Magnetococcales bacterium]|nr:type II secretion system F family protein [Magnetococcales bacterium]
MAKFRYKGRAAGDLVEGVMEGQTPDHVASKLQNRGTVPITIDEINQSRAIRWGVMPRLGGVKVDDLIIFSRQMAALTRSGVPLVRAFSGLIDSTVNSSLKEAMVQVVADLQAGHDLSTSLAEHPRIFDQFFVRVIRVGEEMGRLDDAFAQVLRYLEGGKETRQRIANAVRYPIFVVITVIVAIGVVNYYVIPSFVQLFAKFGSQLPLATRVLLATSKFTNDHAPAIFAVITALIGGCWLSWQTPSGRLFWDRVSLKTPLVGPLMHRIALARISRIFVLASRSGMNMVQILSAVEATVNNRFLAERLVTIRLGVERGESLVQAAQRSAIFTTLVLQMIAVGEETGQVEQMMDEVADFYEQEVDYKIKALTSIIEPILLLFLAGIVLILAVGIFLPLWDLGSGNITK